MYIIKGIQGEVLMKALDENYENYEEKQFIDWVIENEPSCLIEISQFWLFNSFSLTNKTEISNPYSYYQYQIRFIIKILRDNVGILLKTQTSFNQWIEFIYNIPLITDEILEHFKEIVIYIKVEQFESYYESLIQDLVINSYNLKNEIRKNVVKILLQQ